MWTFFKILNFAWLLTSTWLWVTTYVPMLMWLFLVNVLMVFCLSMLPVKIEFTRRTGWVMMAILLLTLWHSYCSGYVIGIYTMLCYLPALYLIMLPTDYLRGLLKFSTKWYAVMLIPALILYWVLAFRPLPSFGKFVHPVYVPFDNYIFYIKSTWDNGIFPRFNAFLLEPGHQALLSTFLLIANRFRFKECKWLIILAAGVIFSFSLAGYLLSFLGFIFLKVDSVKKGALVVLLTAAFILGAKTYLGDDSSLNKLILERLERDESQGIKGNNRFSGNTDFVFERSLKSSDVWVGVSDKVNMELITGAGYKIFIIQYGLIGAILSLMLYITLIPADPDYRYTISFLVILMMCFMQRSYPSWYSWLFPFICGIHIAKDDKLKSETPTPENMAAIS